MIAHAFTSSDANGLFEFTVNGQPSARKAG